MIKKIKIWLWYKRRTLTLFLLSITNEVVLVTGIPRSGSTLVYNICQFICEQKKVAYQSAWINDLKFSFMYGQKIILKIHVYDASLKNYTSIHTYRNLKEVAASQTFKEKHSLDIETIKSYHNWHKSWHQCANLSFDFKALTNMEKTIESIASLLKLSPVNSKKIIDRLEDIARSNKANPVYERHEHHISGAGMHWQQILDTELITAIDALEQQHQGN